MAKKEFENFKERIIEAYQKWGSIEPDPNAVALYTVGGRTWTVKELGREE